MDATTFSTSFDFSLEELTDHAPSSSSSSCLPTLLPTDEHARDRHHTIFLSHSGKQKLFVERLCKRLEGVHYRPFFDQRSHSLPKGERFPDLILEGARNCKVAVVVLSEEFLRSKWTMIELSTFVETSKKNPSLKILPLFYELSVGDLSNIEKIGTWLKQWEEFAVKDGRIQVEQWRKALKALSSWNGLERKKFASDTEYSDEIVSSICNLVPPHILRDESRLHGQDRLCKVIMTKFEELASRNHNSGVSVLGLYGLPGSGKSTLSRCLCNRFHAQFSGKVLYLSLPPKPSSDDVVDKLLKVVLRKLTDLTTDEQALISDQMEVRHLLNYHLPRAKFFLVVDNVSANDESQKAAEAILNACILGNGSKVMFTAQSPDVLRRLLIPHGIAFATMAVPNINEDEAVGILLQCATGSRSHDSEKRDVILEVARKFRFHNPEAGTREYHPLAMETLGALLLQYKDDVPKWKAKLDSVTDLNNAVVISAFREKVITKLIKLSYEELSREMKDIFFDVSLYLIEEITHSVDRAPKLLSIDRAYKDIFLDVSLYRSGSFERACKWLSIVHDCTEVDIQMKLKDLKSWCFLSWNASGSELQVHELYREFAKVAVKEPGSLYLHLTAETGEEARRSVKGREAAIRRIVVEEGGFESVADLQGYSSVEAVLVRHCNSLRELKSESLASLRSLEVDGCRELTRIGGITGSSSLMFNVGKMFREMLWAGGRRWQQQQQQIPRGLGGLQFLELRGIGAERVSSVSDCWDLRVLRLENLPNLKEIPNLSKLTKLETLYFEDTVFTSWSTTKFEAPHLSWCSELQEVKLNLNAELTGFLKFGKLTKLRTLSCRHFGGTELPDLATARETLESLALLAFRNLRKMVPLDGFIMLEELYLRDCAALVELPGLGSLINLKRLDVAGCVSLVRLSGIENSTRLESLDCGGCSGLKELPDFELLPRLRRLWLDGIPGSEIPGLGALSILQYLSVSGCGHLTSVVGLDALTSLYFFCCSGCEALTSLDGLDALTCLGEFDCSRCEALEVLPSLSKSRWMHQVRIGGCRKLTDLKGCERMGLEELSMEGCKSLRRFPLDPGMLPHRLRRLSMDGCCGFVGEMEETLVRWIADGENDFLLEAAASALAWQLQNQEVAEEERAALRHRLAPSIIPRLVYHAYVRLDGDCSNSWLSRRQYQYSCGRLLLCLCWEQGHPHDASIQHFYSTPCDYDFSWSAQWNRCGYIVGMLAAVAATGRNLEAFSKLPKLTQQYPFFRCVALPCLLHHLTQNNPCVFNEWEGDDFLRMKEILQNLYPDRPNDMEWCLGPYLTDTFRIQTLHELDALGAAYI